MVADAMLDLDKDGDSGIKAGSCSGGLLYLVLSLIVLAVAFTLTSGGDQ